MQNSFYARFGWPILAVVVLLFPLAVLGAAKALQSNRNDVKEWLPESFQETQDYQTFQQHFANEAFVLISWDNCTLDDPRLDTFAARLVPPGGEAVEQAVHTEAAASSGYFTKVITGRSVLEQLMDSANLSREQALDRLHGALVGPDRQQTCAVVMLSEQGKQSLHPMLDLITDTAVASGVRPDGIRMGGPSVDNAAIDNESQQMRLQLTILSGLVGLGLCWWCLRNWRLTAIVFLGGAYCAVLSLALVYLSGGEMNSILFTMPAVVYTAGLSCAIHMVNYYRHTRLQEGLDGAPERAIRLAWVPCLLSAGTTSLGLLSLATSELVPIKMFGLYTGLGVMATIGFMYLYLPSALKVWPPPLASLPIGDDGLLASGQGKSSLRLRWLGEKIIARPVYVWVVFMALMAVCGSGLTQAKTTVNLMKLFSPGADIIHSYRWLESKLGAMVPMEVVVRIDPHSSNQSLLERLELVGRIQRNIEGLDNVGSTISSLTFLPNLEIRRGGGLGGAFATRGTRRAVLNRRLEGSREELAEDDYLAIDPSTGEELWRISLRVPGLADVDYGVFVKDIESHVGQLVQREQAEGVTGIRGLLYTGLAPVVYRAERVLLEGLIESFFWAFVMIAAVMTVVFRDLRAGLYTMLPNVWPVAMVFGLMSWFGIELDIGTMMTAGVAMGVCVDDTVHFANWYRRASRLGLNRREAAVMAYENSAGPIYQSTAIVAIGLVTFALSNFMPTQRFGLLMCALLAFGLIADLVLTPAMLAGPVGRFFRVGVVPTGAR